MESKYCVAYWPLSAPLRIEVWEVRLIHAGYVVKPVKEVRRISMCYGGAIIALL